MCNETQPPEATEARLKEKIATQIDEKDENWVRVLGA
jgi:hypothetical protein